ncbi:YqzG/YhdC family protein [Lysinibacillus macroides]|uniref:DUF3889 domain-containing protein n=1 Tax=Lysinibacillus macroides TaxID=33935 RepID=A0A0M9DIC5_9BACI|nr:DUF3889 domain-containing protein [Lysinibacillus macroides]KOY80782.1 hypothetical protein ADM90_16505 [Lysinibacillus macroides]QPR69925.1 YqzG/YhdC family protein [Lysinibacillus macroides]
MKKFYLMLALLFVGYMVPVHIANAGQETPAYAKWGQLAVKEVQAKYPTAKIIDYLHEGKEVRGASTIEKFKLWLKQSDKEFGVYVRISYITASQEIVCIEVQESKEDA